uniref:Transmembrane protein n=1 Tax=Cucumis melo TaxID=3656 RepID=A0A9I9EJ93_CUCME
MKMTEKGESRTQLSFNFSWNRTALLHLNQTNNQSINQIQSVVCGFKSAPAPVSFSSPKVRVSELHDARRHCLLCISALFLILTFLPFLFHSANN